MTERHKLVGFIRCVTDFLHRNYPSGAMDVMAEQISRIDMERARIDGFREAARSRGNDYQRRLTGAGIRPSMSRKGNCWDNAVMESFFSRLKVELIYPEAYRTFESLRTGLFEYLEIFYNRIRRHSALGYLSPVQFESLPNHETVSTVCG